MRDDFTMEIRRYAAGDAASCRACIVQRQEAERQIDSRLRRGEDIADEYLEQMHARCREYAGIILVAVAADEIVGLVMVLVRVPFDNLDEPPGEYAIVAELVVRDAYRRRGIGAALLRAAERYARALGRASSRERV